MFNKKEKYIIKISNRKDEKEILTLFYENNIYWVHKKSTPFLNMPLSEVFEKMNQMCDEFPQYINLSFNDKEQYWVYMYISVDRKDIYPSVETKLNVSQLIRKYKLEKINI